MLTTWILVIYLQGATTVPMESREACAQAAHRLQKTTRMFATCINRTTGEVILP